MIDGIATTGPRRLAVDLGGVVSPAHFRHVVRELRYTKMVEDPDLMRTYLRHKRRGGGALRDWLDRYYDVVGVSESGAELVVLDAILDAGLPTPARQFEVDVDGARYRLDIAYPQLLVALEVDGRQHVDDPDTVENDRIRTGRLRAAGWTLLRVRAAQLASDLPATLSKLETLFGEGSPEVSQVWGQDRKPS